MKRLQTNVRLNEGNTADKLILEDFERSGFKTLGKYIKHVLFDNALGNHKKPKRKTAKQTSKSTKATTTEVLEPKETESQAVEHEIADADEALSSFQL